jgi:hypothetical protein
MAAEQALQLGLQRDDEVVVVAVLLDERVVGVIRSGIAMEAFAELTVLRRSVARKAAFSASVVRPRKNFSK